MKTRRTLIMLCILMWAILAVFPISAFSMTIQEQWDIEENTYTNPETGFKALIADEAKCLSQEEKENLQDSMNPLTQYGNIGCCIIENDGLINKLYGEAREQRKARFKNEKNASILLIIVPKKTNGSYSDEKVYSYLHLEGKFNSFFSQIKREEICNSVDQDLTEKRVYSAAVEVFRQMNEHASEKAAVDSQRLFSYGLIALVLGLTFAIAISFLTRYNPSIHESEDADVVPSQNPHLEITRNHLVSRNTLQETEEA